ncbi:MAG: prolipoprotein diacylglyceryl transferase family protein, partial [Brachybacterium alimentarium]
LYGPELDAWWAWDVTCVTNGQTIGGCEPGMYHPTFLYEQLWNLVGLAVLLLLSRRLQWAGGRVFWAYVAIYSVGRAGIDAIRTEPVLMVGPLRIHTLVAILTALVAIGVFTLLTVRKQRRGGEVVAADGSFELSAQTAGNGPDEDEVEKSGTPPSTGDDPAPGP